MRENVKAYVNGIRVIPKEEEEQIMLFSWAETVEAQHPELRLLFHIPNGGKRGKAEAARFKRAGVRAGVSDLFLPVPRGRFHGLWIEMKAMDGRTSEEQLNWLTEMGLQGYATTICYGFVHARETILRYLEVET